MSSHIANKGPTLASGTVMIDGPDGELAVLVRKLPDDPRGLRMQIVGGPGMGGYVLAYQGDESAIGDALEAAVTAFGLYVARRKA